MRHRAGAFLPGLEFLLRFANFRALPVANLKRDFFQRRRDNRERAEIFGETSAASIPRRAQTRSSVSGARCENAPTAPEILPTETVSFAFSRRFPLRWNSEYQSAQTNPNDVGSAWMPCVRPICGVSLN